MTEEQEKRIKNLVHEVLVLSKKNKEYLDELDYYKNKLDEGSLYVTDKLKIRETDFNYMLKSLQLETQEVKNSLEMEVEEKERLRYEL